MVSYVLLPTYDDIKDEMYLTYNLEATWQTQGVEFPHITITILFTGPFNPIYYIFCPMINTSLPKLLSKRNEPTTLDANHLTNHPN